MFKFKIKLFQFLLAIILLNISASSAQSIKLIPYPQELISKSENFEIDKNVKVVIDKSSEDDIFSASLIIEEIERLTGFRLSVYDAVDIDFDGKIIFLTETGKLKTSDEFLQKNKIELSPDLDPEGYIIDVSSGHVIAAAKSSKGLFYGVQTLRQLLFMNNGIAAIKGVNITDYPAMKIRGVMNDISHTTVTKPEFIKKQIELCAEYKINMFMLYFEQTFNYSSLPLIAPKNGSLSAEDIKELVEFSEKYHVELVPAQESFGHLHDILKYEVYQNISEIPYGNDLTPVNDSSFVLLKNMFSELAPLFKSKYFNIGADETWSLGHGKSADIASKESIGKLYADYITKVNGLLKPFDKDVMFFGDIVLKYPSNIQQLPPNMTALTWHYYAETNYDKFIKPFIENNIKVVVCPSTRSWERLFPNYEISLVNIRNFVRDGQKLNTAGMLNTVWGNEPTLFGMNWYGILFSAASAWQSGESDIIEFKKSFDWAFYRNTDAVFENIISNLSGIHRLFKSVGLSETYSEYFWKDPFTKEGTEFVKKALPIARRIRLSAENALQSLYMNKHKAIRNSDNLDYLIFAAKRLDYLGMLIEYTAEINLRYRNLLSHPDMRKKYEDPFIRIGHAHGLIYDLLDALSDMKDQYKELWFRENYKYRFDRVMIKYYNSMSYWEKKRELFVSFLAKLRAGETLPEPESLGLFIAN